MRGHNCVFKNKLHEALIFQKQLLQAYMKKLYIAQIAVLLSTCMCVHYQNVMWLTHWYTFTQQADENTPELYHILLEIGKAKRDQ